MICLNMDSFSLIIAKSNGMHWLVFTWDYLKEMKISGSPRSKFYKVLYWSVIKGFDKFG